MNLSRTTMDSSQWRDTSHIVVSDSEDEIPGSRDTSNLEDVSKLDRGSISMSRTSKPVRSVTFFLFFHRVFREND